MPTKTSSVVGRIWHGFVWLNLLMIVCTKVLVNGHSINVCSMESLSPQCRHLLSGLIPNLNSSLFVAIIIWMSLNWNSLSLVSLQRSFKDFIKILPQVSLFVDRFWLQRRRPVWGSLWVFALSGEKLNYKSVAKEIFYKHLKTYNFRNIVQFLKRILQVVDNAVF